MVEVDSLPSRAEPRLDVLAGLVLTQANGLWMRWHVFDVNVAALVDFLAGEASLLGCILVKTFLYSLSMLITLLDGLLAVSLFLLFISFSLCSIDSRLPSACWLCVSWDELMLRRLVLDAIWGVEVLITDAGLELFAIKLLLLDLLGKKEEMYIVYEPIIRFYEKIGDRIYWKINSLTELTEQVV